MNKNVLLTAIVDAMIKKAEAIYAVNPDYQKHGRRGFAVTEIRNDDVGCQWDSSSRPFGEISLEPENEGPLIINNGVNFEAAAWGKIAYSRRTGKNSGANYYEVRGSESWWYGALISADGRCICAFSGLKGHDDVTIAQAGLDEYNRR
jgi:hypothetical protein